MRRRAANGAEPELPELPELPEAGGRQLGQDGGRVRMAFAGLLGEGAGGDPLQGLRNVRTEPAQSRRILVEDGMHHALPFTAERALPGQHLVEHGTERPEVRAGPLSSPWNCSGAM